MEKKNEKKKKIEENEDSSNKKNYENNEIDVEDTDGSETGYSDDNYSSSDDNYSRSDDDAESNTEKNNDETDEETETDSDTDEKEILKSLLLLNQFKKRKKENKKKEFLPSLKTFFKTSMKKKYKLYNSSIRKKTFFLAKNILLDKIPCDFSPEYCYILNKFVKRKMHSNDIRIAVCEDYCLGGIFSEAI